MARLRVDTIVGILSQKSGGASPPKQKSIFAVCENCLILHLRLEGMQVPGDRKSKGIDQEVHGGPVSPGEAPPGAVTWRAADTNPNGPARIDVGRAVE